MLWSSVAGILGSNLAMCSLSGVVFLAWARALFQRFRVLQNVGGFSGDHKLPESRLSTDGNLLYKQPPEKKNVFDFPYQARQMKRSHATPREPNTQHTFFGAVVLRIPPVYHLRYIP